MTIGYLGAKAGFRVLHLREELFAAVGTAEHRHDALDMRGVVGVAACWDDDVAEERRRRGRAELPSELVAALQLHQLHLQGGRGFIHWDVEWGCEEFEVRSKCPDSSEAARELLLQGSNNISTGFAVDIIRGTGSQTREVIESALRQLCLPQAQFHLEGSDVGIRAVHNYTFLEILSGSELMWFLGSRIP